MKWTRKEFIKMFGEDPVDFFGPDWKNYIQEYDKDELYAVTQGELKNQNIY